MGKLGTLFLLFLLGSGSMGIGYGIWRQSAPRAERHVMAASFAHLPDYVQNIDADGQAAYQFATDNPKILKQIPCYCGCEKMLGHKHNLACYITAFNPDGSVAQYTDHAAYCTVCLDITRVVREMVTEGKTVQAIHNAIDIQYGNAGPHTHDTVQ